jgi:CheY-like chemotaxis protein
MARVLVVEDHVAIGGAVRNGLTGFGQNVTLAGRPAAKDWTRYATARSSSPWSGSVFRIWTGVDLCRRIRADQPRCVVVILTA